MGSKCLGAEERQILDWIGWKDAVSGSAVIRYLKRRPFRGSARRRIRSWRCGWREAVWRWGIMSTVIWRSAGWSGPGQWEWTGESGICSWPAERCTAAGRRQL